MQYFISAGLGLAIAIVFPFMVGFGIEAFYQSPKSPYEVCLDKDPNTKPAEPTREIAVDPKTDPTYKNCFDSQQTVVDTYNRNLFLIAAIAAFSAIAAGTLIISEKMGPVGPGLVFGGLFTLLYANARTVSSIDKRWIFTELVFVFFGLIFITTRFLKATIKPKK